MLDSTSVIDLALRIGIPNDWPDHYEHKKEPERPKLDVRALLNAVRPALNFKKRI